MNQMREAFAKFHAQNPEVYLWFERFTREALGTGRHYLSPRLVWERMRWEREVITRGDPFKLNDHFHAYYAREFMARNPELGPVFRTRRVCT